jgi:hypothetical protein
LIFDAILNSEHQGLLIIGENDPHYNTNQIEELSKSNLQLEVIQNANHHLDIGEFETTNSIFALSRVMEILQETVSPQK